MTTRLAETDSLSTNKKAERILQSRSSLAAEQSPMQTLHLFCAAHRLHSSAQRTWAGAPHIMSGIARYCLVLGGPHAMAKFRAALHKCIDQPGRVDIIHGRQLSEEAVRYRDLLLPYVLPPETHPRRRAAIKLTWDTVVSGNLMRSGVLEHLCSPECCSSPHVYTTFWKMSLLWPSVMTSCWKLMAQKATSLMTSLSQIQPLQQQGQEQQLHQDDQDQQRSRHHQLGHLHLQILKCRLLRPRQQYGCKRTKGQRVQQAGESSESQGGSCLYAEQLVA